MLFTKVEIKALGKQEIKYQRALACIPSLHDIHSNENEYEDLLQISCSCYGSSYASYKVSINIAKNDRAIKKAICSCPYMNKTAAEDEICKHILAALLRFCCKEFADDNRNDEENVPVQAPKSLEFQKITASARKRKLPSWMKIANTKVTMPSDRKGIGDLGIAGTLNKERRATKKERSLVKRTVYCMTPEEFIRTAEEIIEENDISEKAGTCESIENQVQCESSINEHREPEQDIDRKSSLGLSESDKELEDLLFGTTSTSVNQFIINDHYDQTKKSDSEAFSGIQSSNETAKEIQDETESHQEELTQNLFDSYEKLDSEIDKDNDSVLDDLLSI